MPSIKLLLRSVASSWLVRDILHSYWSSCDQWKAFRPMGAWQGVWAGLVAPRFPVHPEIPSSAGSLDPQRRPIRSRLHGIALFSLAGACDVAVPRALLRRRRRQAPLARESQVGLSSRLGIREMKGWKPICLLSAPLGTTITSRALIGGRLGPPGSSAVQQSGGK